MGYFYFGLNILSPYFKQVCGGLEREVARVSVFPCHNVMTPIIREPSQIDLRVGKLCDE